MIYENLFYSESANQIRISHVGGIDLVIDRNSFSVNVGSRSDPALHTQSNPIQIYGATGREAVGRMGKYRVYRLTNTKTVRIASASVLLKGNIKADELKLLNMIESLMSLPSIYFTLDYDLTINLQRLGSVSSTATLAERADKRFFFNHFALKSLLGTDAEPYCLPLMVGSVYIENGIKCKDHTVDLFLISRRSVKRAGVRYIRRGIDDHGNVANYVETELIVNVNGETFSYVQIRGSVPVYWSQYPNIQYKPKPIIRKSTSQSVESAKLHFKQESNRFGGSVICADLVDQSGVESPVHNEFKTMMAELTKDPEFHDKVLYADFDFHHHCSKRRWDRVSILIDQVKKELERQSYFHLGKDGKVNSTQRGVVRTNCMDCLDRTNVVQGMLAKHKLNEFLTKIGILNNGESMEKNLPVLLEAYQKAWTLNAHAISIQYAGSNALKTAGVFMDGLCSVTRYAINNWQDGFRQDQYDLFLGNFQIKDRSTVSPFQPRKRMLNIAAVWAIIFVVSLVALKTEYITAWLCILTWFLTFALLLLIILRNGKEYIDRPFLSKLPED